MLKRATIEREAKDKAGYMFYEMTKGLERESGWAGIEKRLMEVGTKHIQKAMTEAYFYALRDARMLYEELHDFDRFKAALEGAAEALTRKEANNGQE